MQRRTDRSTLALLLVPTLALGLSACSFRFQAGSQPADDTTAKPAKGTKPVRGDGDGSTKPVADAGDPTRKPVGGGGGGAGGSGGDDSEPPTTDTPEPDPPGGGDEPTPTAKPLKTAVCRVGDAALAELCHRVFDPIAADDLDAWISVLGDDVVLTRPSHEDGHQRMTGPESVRRSAQADGGVRSFLHLGSHDRVVGTVSNDCRNCRRAFVAFQANTRTGTMMVSVDLGQPPHVFAVEVGSHIRRPKIGTTRKPGTETPPNTVEIPTGEPTEPEPVPPARTIVAPPRGSGDPGERGQ